MSLINLIWPQSTNLNVYLMRSILLFILMVSSFSLVGQRGQGQRSNPDERMERKHEHPSAEKLQAQKIAFFTMKMDLTPEEAQNFWPLYNEFSDKKMARRNGRKERPNLHDISDADANKMIDEYIENKQNELDLNKEYIVKFKSVIPPQKVMMVFMLERKFKEEMLNDVRRRLNENN